MTIRLPALVRPHQIGEPLEQIMRVARAGGGFRVMKQTLKISHFIGRSENAVRIQIAVALIAFLLLKILNKMSQDKQTLLDTTRLVRSNLMHRKDFTRLRQLHPPSQLDSQQFMLNWAST